MINIVGLARVCHEANRALRQAFGDHLQVAWEDAPDWQRDSAFKSVQFVLEYPDAPASALHDAWSSGMMAGGWVYGIVKDVDAKTHPCLVPFEQLPPEQQAKGLVLRAIVKACIPKSMSFS